MKMVRGALCLRFAPLVLLIGCGRFNFDATGDSRAGSDGANGSDAGSNTGSDAGAADPPAFVQQANGPDMAPLVTAYTLAFPSPVSAGNLLFVYGDSRTPAVTNVGVTDTLGNTYVVSSGVTVAGSNVAQYIAYTISTSAGPDTITITTNTAPTGFWEERIKEYSGVDPASPLAHPVQTFGGNAALDSAISATITTTVANELLLGICVDGTVAAGTGMTLRDNAFLDVGEELIAPTPGGYHMTATPDAGWTFVVTALRPAP
jgi:hypothetical protein